MNNSFDVKLKECRDSKGGTPYEDLILVYKDGNYVCHTRDEWARTRDGMRVALPPSGPPMHETIDRPKRAKSAYLYFTMDERENVKGDLDTNNAKDIMSELGLRWNELKNDPESADVYNKYLELARKDKERYESEKRYFTEITKQLR